MRLFAVVARVVALLALALSAALLPAAPARAQSAALAVSPPAAPQNSTVALSLSGFAPREAVSLWLTLPDYSVAPLGDLTADGAGAAGLELFVGVDVPVGRHAISARGNRSGRLASAPFELAPAAGAPATPGVSIAVAQERLPQGQCLDFSAAGFAAGEPISVWLNLPDGTVSADGLESGFAADSAGGFAYGICFSNLTAEGRYSFSAAGRASGRVGIAGFSLVRGDYLGDPVGQAALFVDPPQARQLDTVTVVGGGFRPGERVILWLTLPNGVVLDLFSGRTEDGTFAVDVALPALPVGRHAITAYGETSGLRGVATLDLLPGDGG